MQKVALYNMKAEQIGEIELSDAIFGVEINKPALHIAVRSYLANQRQGTQSTLTRAEVKGGGRKPWRQKGTGRARHGSTRSPQWTHGGVAFAPKPRSYSFSVNKKIKRLALKSALTSKAIENNIIVVDELVFNEYKTKNVVEMLKAFGVDKKALIVTSDSNKMMIASAANIPGISTTPADTLNTYDVLLHNKFIVAKNALAKIEEVYA